MCIYLNLSKSAGSVSKFAAPISVFKRHLQLHYKMNLSFTYANKSVSFFIFYGAHETAGDVQSEAVLIKDVLLVA